MPYTLQYDPAEQFGVIELRGVIRWADIQAILEALFNAPTWEVGSSVLWRTRDLGSIVLEPEELGPIRATMKRLAQKRVGGRSAVVSGDAETAMLSRLIVGLAPETSREMGIFESMEDALAFLGHRKLSETAITLAEVS